MGTVVHNCIVEIRPEDIHATMHHRPHIALTDGIAWATAIERER